MRAWILRVLLPRPLPLQVGQGSSVTRPRPLHSLHGSDSEKPPRFLLSCPVPAHLGQTFGALPGRAPLPLQVGQAASLLSANVRVTPSAASLKVSVVSVSTSAARREDAARPRPPDRQIGRASWRGR